jgi:hypothetical protein
MIGLDLSGNDREKRRAMNQLNRDDSRIANSAHERNVARQGFYSGNPFFDTLSH